MSETICQSCGMPMGNTDLLGTNQDGSKNTEYCTYCYQNGSFTDSDMTLQKMIEVCVPFMVQEGMAEEEARKQLNEFLPGLKRWK